MAALSSDARLLVFPLDEMPARPNGGVGVQLMALPDKVTLAAVAVTDGKSLVVSGIKRKNRAEETLDAKKLAEYIGKRAQRGRVCDVGFRPDRLGEPEPRANRSHWCYNRSNVENGNRGPDAPAVLANLLFGVYRHRVLSLLLLRPGDRFHVRMISRLTGVPAGSLHRELRQLAEAGLLVAERSGNQVLYSANEASPVFHELAAMLDKTAGTPPMLHEHAAEYTIEPAGRLPEVDRKALAAICRKYGVKKMSLFGSAARNELRPDSDVDLLVEFRRSSKTTLSITRTCRTNFRRCSASASSDRRPRAS